LTSDSERKAGPQRVVDLAERPSPADGSSRPEQLTALSGPPPPWIRGRAAVRGLIGP
jgi:hypothetical protein